MIMLLPLLNNSSLRSKHLVVQEYTEKQVGEGHDRFPRASETTQDMRDSVTLQFVEGTGHVVSLWNGHFTILVRIEVLTYIHVLRLHLKYNVFLCGDLVHVLAIHILCVRVVGY